LSLCDEPSNLSVSRIRDSNGDDLLRRISRRLHLSFSVDRSSVDDFERAAHLSIS